MIDVHPEVWTVHKTSVRVQLSVCTLSLDVMCGEAD